MAKINKFEKCSDCNFNTVLYEDYYKTSGNTYCLKESRDIYTEDIPSWCSLEDAPDPHELWAAAQLMPGEGIEDGVRRIEEILNDVPNTEGE